MPTSILQKPIPTTEAAVSIGPVPACDGYPTWMPTDDQIPLAVDPRDGTLWAWVKDLEGSSWVPVHKFELKRLEEISLRNISNLENALRVPLAYEAGKEIVEGYVTLKEMKQILDKVSE